MRIYPAVALVLIAVTAQAQSAPWSQVNPALDLPRLESANLTPAQLNSVGKFLRKYVAGGAWDCSGDEIDELIHGLSYSAIPVAQGQNVILAEAPAGCARGGQGSNGAMWLIRLNGNKPIVLADPEDRFEGWLFSIQPTVSHGYRDIILGWHMGAFDQNLTYFRFDGKHYDAIGVAQLITDPDTEKTTLTPR
jgi:hypothetical protein